MEEKKKENKICCDCARRCKVDLSVQKGFCGKDGQNIRVAKAMRHMWEEPLISGKKGSGAIFFSHCSLKCCFCQNFEISHLGKGKDLTIDEFVSLIKKVESENVENINFVTPSHYTTEIITALKEYRPKIPIVFNCSGYEHNLERLRGLVDIFLFDFKYFSSELSKKYSLAKDYFEVCLNSLKKAREIVGKDYIENGIMKSGIIIRHLVLPSHYEDSIKIFEELYKNGFNDTYISLMSQFVPFYKAKEYDNLSCGLKPIEYKKVISRIKKLGFNKGFIQEPSSATCDYTPNFDLQNFYEF